MSDYNYSLLDKINEPKDFRSFNLSQLQQLNEELRKYLIDVILREGGHFSANLGVVELTVALHYCFNTPQDKLIWDVGHQAYGHKVLTGRKDQLSSIRKKDGLSGFPKINESEYDTFGTGHSSTSLSAALGLAEAALLQQEKRQHIAVIGDGSLTAGMAWEALNNIGQSQANLLIVVNDNQMGIDPNQGALGQHLNELDNKASANNVFRAFNLPYYGPFNGHDLGKLIQVLKEQTSVLGPRVVHIKTIKGKGYEPAEREQSKWHSAAKYVKVDAKSEQIRPLRYQDVFGETLLKLAQLDKKVVGITPAMPSGSGMSIMMNQIPERVYDTGISEQHAVTFSAGLALGGLKPFCHLYSTFLQRAYDQLIHDVALQNIPVVFCLDRAGVVGEDGPTHHGLYDLAFLKPIPNLTICAPSNGEELKNMMFTSLHLNGPIAIRYPKGEIPSKTTESDFSLIPIGKANLIKKGADVLLLGLGHAVNILIECSEILEKMNIQSTVVDMRFLKPLDESMLLELVKEHSLIVSMEDGCLKGGFGESISDTLVKHAILKPLLKFGFPDEVIEHDTRKGLFHQYELDAGSVAKRVLEHFQTSQ